MGLFLRGKNLLIIITKIWLKNSSFTLAGSVSAACLIDTRFEANDADHSSDIPNLNSCKDFCIGKSEFFTYADYDTECWCKYSNAETSTSPGDLSGEINCYPGQWSDG